MEGGNSDPRLNNLLDFEFNLEIWFVCKIVHLAGSINKGVKTFLLDSSIDFHLYVHLILLTDFSSSQIEVWDNT